MKFKYFGLLIILTLLLLVSNKKTTRKDFDTYRLGNFLDAWYFSKIGSQERKKQFTYLIEKNSNKKSLGGFLSENKNLLEEIKEKEKKIKLVEESEKNWASYYYKNIEICLENYSKNLQFILTKFDSENKNQFKNQKYTSKNHVVLHYRLGDYILLGDCIDWRCLILEMKKLNIDFDTIELMDGGKVHNPFTLKTFFSSKDVKSESEKIQREFYENLKKEFPNSNIIYCDNKGGDMDFFRMLMAPILITGGGSYAIGAAIGGWSKIIRTPACKTLDFPSQGFLEPFKLNKKDCDWKTYSYTML